MIPISHLQRYRLIYVATPFTKYEAGLEAAFIDACKLSARLLQSGLLQIRCPIAEAYPIALHGSLNPLDLAVWQPFCDATLAKSDALLIGKLNGWGDSDGIKHEIHEFVLFNKPTYTIDPESMEVERL